MNSSLRRLSDSKGIVKVTMTFRVISQLFGTKSNRTLGRDINIMNKLRNDEPLLLIKQKITGRC